MKFLINANERTTNGYVCDNYTDNCGLCPNVCLCYGGTARIVP